MPCVCKPFCTALALAIGSFSVGACAKSEEAHAAETQTEVTQPSATRSMPTIHDDRVARSNAAVQVLASAQTARGNLAKGDLSTAKLNIEAAMAALNRIGSVALVPIYTEVSEASFIGGVQAAKAGKPAASGSSPVAVRAVAASYSRILLDTSVSRRQLEAAQAAVRRSDPTSADTNLKMLQRSVVLEGSTVRMPLTKARQNLALASAAAAHEDWKQTQVELQATSEALADFAMIAPVADVADVKILQEQIAAFAGKVMTEHTDAASRINQWWVQTAKLTENSR